MSQNRDRNALIETILAQLRRQLEAELPDETATLDQIETAVTHIGGTLRRELQERLLEERSRGPRDNQATCPQCGQWARYRAMAGRTLITAHGELTLRRAYYHCDGCGHGFAPLDPALGLDAAHTTLQVREWLAHLGAHLSFELARALLARLTGVRVGESTAERVTVAAGTALGLAQRQQVTLAQQRGLPPPAYKPRRLYGSLDGIMAPLRDPWKRDGSAGALTCRFGECKTVVFYEAAATPEGDVGVVQRAYLATFDDVAALTPRVGVLAQQCGWAFAKEKIIVADGAPWIWLLVARQCPGAVEIVDFYHASEHLWAVARAWLGTDAVAAQTWVQARQAELLHDQGAAVLAAIAAWEPQTKEGCDLQAREYEYFRHNQARMRYGTFRAKGYHIGSGVMEAGCKQVVAQRLDQAGMHWRQEVAEAVVTLRAALLSTHPPDLRPYLSLST